MEELSVDEEIYVPPFRADNFEQNLIKFRAWLSKIIAQIKEQRAESGAMPGATIDYEQFHNEIISFFGDDIKTQEIKAFFRKISSNPEAPIDWSELFGYFQTEENILDFQMNEENSVFMVSKRERVENATGGGKKRRDIIQCIVKIPLLDAIITASEKGTLTLYSNKFLHLKMQSAINTNEGGWMTGCDFLYQLRRIVAVTERSIVIWDYKYLGKSQANYLTIKPMENCLLCVCTVIETDLQGKDDILIGDDSGCIHLFTIASDDLKTKHSKSKCVTSPEVLDASKFKKIKRKLHNDWVLKIKFYPELKCFASCSFDSQHSFILDRVKRLRETGPVRELSVPRGVNAFAYCIKANIIATGGFDKIIRLWHPNIFSKPVGKLVGHLYAITEITINEKDQHIISLSTARGFKVWDIQTLTLLQVFLDTGEGPGDRSIRSMIFDSKHLRLITGSCVLDLWPLTRMVQDTRQAPHTHEKAINVLVYNSALHQVLTICSESIVKVWEFETGYQIYEIADAHGTTIEVTAAAIDNSGYHLATGACNGSLKVWDFGKGQELKVLPSKEGYKEEEKKICQLAYLLASNHQHTILLLENSGRIKMIQGKEGDSYLNVILEFPEIIDPNPSICILETPKTMDENVLEDQFLPHTDSMDSLKKFTGTEKHVICFDLLKQDDYSLLATGSVNGLLTLWDLESATAQKVFKTESTEDQMKQLTPGDLKLRRVNAVKFIYPVTTIRKITSVTAEIPGSQATSLPKTTSRLEAEQKQIDRLHSKASGIVKVHSLDESEKESWDIGRNSSTTSDLIYTYKDLPILASAHENGYLYLWSTQGELLKTVIPVTKYSAIPLTVLCTDKSAKVILAGNSEGFIIFWDIGIYLQDAPPGTKSIKQKLYWKAHALKVVGLFYVEKKNIVVSASDDNSVRLWYGPTGHYIGYFGQHRVFRHLEPTEFILPCDINEVPVKTRADAINILGKKQKYEYPLIFDRDRWESLEDQTIALKEPLKPLEVEHKYFKSLASPKVKRVHLESFTTGDRESGAVFRALPIYTVGKGLLREQTHLYLTPSTYG
uniref:WD repeat-containing protein 64 isoform X3 n=1 Tax=Geotrypetes seraphini TaxID=260995 RepID=A0A6P8PUA5_GEOSA|nr:WD repeat-containing protein 64 isoform X3 [Geotrypetes seraphini]